MTKPIHDDEDYKMTLAKIESLWGAKEGSPEGLC